MDFLKDCVFQSMVVTSMNHFIHKQGKLVIPTLGCVFVTLMERQLACFPLPLPLTLELCESLCDASIASFARTLSSPPATSRFSSSARCLASAAVHDGPKPRRVRHPAPLLAIRRVTRLPVTLLGICHGPSRHAPGRPPLAHETLRIHLPDASTHQRSKRWRGSGQPDFHGQPVLGG